MPCGSRTRLTRVEAWHLCRSAKGTLISGRRGIRPPTVQIKSLLCCRYTTISCMCWYIRFQRFRITISRLLLFVLSLSPSIFNWPVRSAVSVPNSPRRNRTFISALSERRPDPLNDRALLNVGMVELEPAVPARIDDSVAPNHVGCRSPTSRMSVRTVGFEPTISWPPDRRDTRLRFVLLLNTP